MEKSKEKPNDYIITEFPFNDMRYNRDGKLILEKKSKKQTKDILDLPQYDIPIIPSNLFKTSSTPSITLEEIQLRRKCGELTNILVDLSKKHGFEVVSNWLFFSSQFKVLPIEGNFNQMYAEYKKELDAIDNKKSKTMADFKKKIVGEKK